jgi:hypothetical protein
LIEYWNDEIVDPKELEKGVYSVTVPYSVTLKLAMRGT